MLNSPTTISGAIEELIPVLTDERAVIDAAIEWRRMMIQYPRKFVGAESDLWNSLDALIAAREKQ